MHSTRALCMRPVWPDGHACIHQNPDTLDLGLSCKLEMQIATVCPSYARQKRNDDAESTTWILCIVDALVFLPELL